MALWQRYMRPKDLREALEALRQNPGSARVIAGGTDLLLDLQKGHQAPLHTLVDLSAIPELKEIRFESDHILVGAVTPLRQVIEHPQLRREASALVEACELIGGPQVRNVATLGGNVAHALPAADGTIALVALEAHACLASSDGIRWLPVLDLFEGPGRPAFDPRREILTAFRLPRIGPGQASAFERVMRPQGVAIAILNLGLWLRVSPGGRMEDLRIAIGPSGPRPFRARRTEAVLRDRIPDPEALVEAARALRSEATFRTSPHRATAEYRDHLSEILLRRTFRKAWAAWLRQRDELEKEGVGP